MVIAHCFWVLIEFISLYLLAFMIACLLAHDMPCCMLGKRIELRLSLFSSCMYSLGGLVSYVHSSVRNFLSLFTPI